MGVIRGTYLKDGDVTELYLPNGITEIQCEGYAPMEIDVPEFALAKKATEQKRRRWTAASAAKEILLMISVLVPFAFFTWLITDMLSDNLVLALGYLGAQLWLFIFLYANFRTPKSEKKPR